MEAQPDSLEPKLFSLIRHEDDTGISGKGRVLDGVIFHTGQVVVCWRSDLKSLNPGFSSIVIFPSWEAFEAVHILPHPTNKSEIVRL